jgi:hypothetical protein
MKKITPIATICLLALPVLVAPGIAVAQQAPTSISDVKAPVAPVPQLMSLQGEFVRVAYNNEGFVTLGYRVANGSVGDEWMLLDVGVTVRAGMKAYDLKREAMSLKTPDGKLIPLATQKEYASAGYLPALNKRAQITRDNLNYFPPEVNKACALLFFSDLGKPKAPPAFDQVDLTDNRACLGRLFFKVPGGIQTGQHWLVTKFATTEVHVPFRILTKEEEKFLRKNWDDLNKALQEGVVD